MPAEHQLMTGATGLYGKHPGFGDFVAAGLPDNTLRPVADWLQAVLGAWREAMGESWQTLFDTSPMLSFWIGPALVDGLPIRGVWLPSRDRTGRRFPFLILQSGGMPPVMEAAGDPAQDFYRIAGLGLQNLLEAPVFEPRDAAERLRQQLPMPSPDPQPDWPTFWALNPAMDAQSLLTDLSAADHLHATASRSYWWFSANEGAGGGVLACQGLPGPSELGWLMTGGLEPDPVSQDDSTEGGVA